MIKTRFAASPTGFLHIGGLRTALFSYLFAKKNGGKFLMRIEDTDRERFVEGGIENILNSLYWSNIIPDEGVSLDLEKNIIQKGNNGPYIQSERLDIYKKYIQELLDNNHAYHCFCSKERLDELRKEQEKNKQATGYDGHCCNLKKEEVEEKLKSGTKGVVRMKMMDSGKTKVKDLIRGDVEFENKLIDDQVILKSDGYPTYHLAVVVDDHLMEITHVIRGEEWLPSTPKHIALYNMFGWKVPEFAHLPLLINEKKQKLSKRHGDVSVQDFREKGYFSDALVNFIAFLGWNPGDEREFFTIHELEKEFSLERVGKQAAVFNNDKLDWYNGQHIKKMGTKELVENSIPFLKNGGLLKDENYKIEDLEKVLELVKDRLLKLSNLPELVGFMFAEDLNYESSLIVWKKSTSEETKSSLNSLIKFLDTLESADWEQASLEKRILKWIEESDLTIGEVLWPMRVALSGLKNSPGPFEIASALGKEKSLKRLKYAESLL